MVHACKMVALAQVAVCDECGRAAARACCSRRRRRGRHRRCCAIRPRRGWPSPAAAPAAGACRGVGECLRNLRLRAALACLLQLAGSTCAAAMPVSSSSAQPSASLLHSHPYLCMLFNRENFRYKPGGTPSWRQCSVDAYGMEVCHSCAGTRRTAEHKARQQYYR